LRQNGSARLPLFHRRTLNLAHVSWADSLPDRTIE
jgi:hypothetical protein